MSKEETTDARLIRVAEGRADVDDGGKIVGPSRYMRKGNPRLLDHPTPSLLALVNIPRSINMPTIEWPIPKPASDWDLAKDPVHRHTKPRDMAVTMPGSPHQFQLASEAPPHLWPHNATSLGFVRALPMASSHWHAPSGLNCLGFRKNGHWINVFFAFMYTCVILYFAGIPG